MQKPFSYKILTQVLVSMVVILSIVAGYYHAALVAEQKKYARIEDKYVRVRNELGVDKTQELIDNSYKTDRDLIFYHTQ